MVTLQPVWAFDPSIAKQGALRGKGRVPLFSPAGGRSHQEQNPALCLQQAELACSVFPLKEDTYIPINKLQTIVNYLRALFSGSRALLFMKPSIKIMYFACVCLELGKV